MARSGVTVGYVETVETRPGVWTDQITEKKYRADIQKNYWRNESADKVNDDIRINNQISIVADTYAYHHIHTIKYVNWAGVKWKINTVEVNYPRLIFTIGGEYHGSDGQTSGAS